MRRPLLIGLIAGAVVFVALAVAAVFFAVSVADRNDAVADHRVAAGALAEAVEASETAVAEADAVLSYDADPLLDAASVTALIDARESASARIDASEAALGTDPESLDTEAMRDLTTDLRIFTDDVRSDDELVFSAVSAVAGLAAGAAPTIDAANFDAENQPRIAFRDAVTELELAADDQAAEHLVDFLEAAHALEASHAEEIAEKSGPLLDQRLAVEAFARTQSGGVLLDFDWAGTVNGYGTGGSYGGTSYWSSSDGGYATITLSDSVATMWPSAGVQSLVMHEIGHAVLARSDCNTLFFESEYESGGEEPWATAWAIGMGYTADGSGESIYGRPAEGLIELATRCR